MAIQTRQLTTTYKFMEVPRLELNPGTLSNQCLILVSIGWFQIITWKMGVSPNIHLKLVVWGSRIICFFQLQPVVFVGCKLIVKMFSSCQHCYLRNPPSWTKDKGLLFLSFKWLSGEKGEPPTRKQSTSIGSSVFSLKMSSNFMKNPRTSIWNASTITWCNKDTRNRQVDFFSGSSLRQIASF